MVAIVSPWGPHAPSAWDWRQAGGKNASFGAGLNLTRYLKKQTAPVPSSRAGKATALGAPTKPRHLPKGVAQHDETGKFK